MGAGFVTLPAGGSYRLGNARVPAALVDAALPGPVEGDGLVRLDLEIRDGRVASIAPVGALAGGIDLRGGQVWPGFVDLHTHLDKGHIWPRAANPDGSFMGAVTATMADRAVNWSAGDVERRFEFGLAASYAHGTVAIRTHIDSYETQAETSWGVFRALRERWAGRIDLQASSIAPIDRFGTDFGVTLADLVARSGGILGCVTRLSGGDHEEIPQEFHDLLDRVFALAMDRGLDLDLHVDESGDSGAKALIHVARTVMRRGFKGRVTCGHCCSLSVQPEAFVEETLTACADAGIAVVSLPMCNMYLQNRQPGRTPRWRGVTLLHEMKARGIPVAVSSDNCRDPFYAYGDHDVHEVYVQATRIAHLDHPIGDWPRVVTATPAAIMGLRDRGTIRVGAPADLVLFRARHMSELLSRRQADRVVLRHGRAIDTTLPDYALLDGLAGEAKDAAA